MSISARPFDKTPDGQQVTEFILTNKHGASISVIDFGGCLRNIIVPDRGGNLADVNLGFDDVDTYDGKSNSMGALIGRVGNRIGGASFQIDGVTYDLFKNDGENNLHSGPKGVDRYVWASETIEGEGWDKLILTHTTPDGDCGFPGTVNMEVTYSWNDEGELGIHYFATTDKTTLVNMTNHAYFNLDGHDTPDVRDLTLQINAPAVNEVDDGLIPTGVLLKSETLPYGFATEARVGDVLALTDVIPAMKKCGGVDFNYCAGHDKEMKLIAVLKSPKTGRVMEVITDQPGVQCYTGQGLNHTGKGGVHYGKYAGLCLETQHYPDAIHQPQFHSIVLRPEDTYDTTTIYKFYAE